jgi:site-specific DNA-methyltransferase (adenine-specific)
MNWPDDFINKVICGDCLEVLPLIPYGAVDLVITDPPYGMNFQSNHRNIKHLPIAGDDRFPIEVIEQFVDKGEGTQENGFYGNGYRAVYVFCRWDNLRTLPKPKSVIAWVKNNWSMGDLEHEHGRQWEAICFYPLSGHQFIKRIPDVIYGDRTGNNSHPTEKPIEVLRQIIAANKGDIILDPFCGSGTTLVAAKQLGRRYIGIEISEKYCKIAEDRLKQEQLAL